MCLLFSDLSFYAVLMSQVEVRVFKMELNALLVM